MSRLKHIKEQTELLTLRMQTFCLDPKWQNFIDIIYDKKIQNEQSDVFDYWKKACLAKYGYFWTEWYEHELLKPDVLDKITTETIDMSRRLQTRLQVQPRPVLLDRMWYLFFATGDLGCLREAYSVGSSQNSKTLALNAVEMFQKFRNFYESKIADALKNDVKYFEHHEIAEIASELELPNPLEGLRDVFSKLDKTIDDAMNRLHEARDVGDDISPEMQKILDTTLDKNHLDLLKQFMVDDIDISKTKKQKVDSNGKPIPDGYVEYTKRVEKKELKRLGSLFDKIAEQTI